MSFRHLALTSPENFVASIAARGELFIVATAAVDPVGFRAELFVDERFTAGCAVEAGLVPVFILVGQILQQKFTKF